MWLQDLGTSEYESPIVVDDNQGTTGTLENCDFG